MKSEVLNYNRHPGTKNLFFEGDIIGDIDPGKYHMGNGNLVTTAASTCIVLAAHNEQTRRGLLGHFSAVTEESQEGQDSKRSLEKALDAVGSLGDPEATSIWLGGGAPHMQAEIDMTEQDRAYVNRKVHEVAAGLKIGGDQIDIAWSGAGRVIDVELDCSKGVLVAHDYPEA
jgi:hypothetical protein